MFVCKYYEYGNGPLNISIHFLSLLSLVTAAGIYANVAVNIIIIIIIMITNARLSLLFSRERSIMN